MKKLIAFLLLVQGLATSAQTPSIITLLSDSNVVRFLRYSVEFEKHGDSAIIVARNSFVVDSVAHLESYLENGAAHWVTATPTEKTAYANTLFFSDTSSLYELLDSIAVNIRVVDSVYGSLGDGLSDSLGLASIKYIGADKFSNQCDQLRTICESAAFRTYSGAYIHCVQSSPGCGWMDPCAVGCQVGCCVALIHDKADCFQDFMVCNGA